MLLPSAGIMGSLPWPPSIYMGSGDLLSVPCVCTTNTWSTEPDPQTQHWLFCPPTTRRAPLFPDPLHCVLEMTEPWDHALKLLNFESQYLLLPLKGGKKKRRRERETRKPQTWQRNMMGPYNTLLAPTCLARKEFSRAQRSSEWQLFSFEVWGRRGVDSNSSTFKKKIFYLFLSHVYEWYLHACMCTTHMPGVHRGQEEEGTRSPGTGIYIWLWFTMCVQGTKPASYTRTANTVNHLSHLYTTTSFFETRSPVAQVGLELTT